MSLMDIYRADIAESFLNLEEFGRMVELNGSFIVGMTREESAVDSNVSNEYSREVIDPALPSRTLVLHAATADIPDEVQMGRDVVVDGFEYGVLFRSDPVLPLTKLILERQGY